MSRYIIDTDKIEANIETVKRRAGVPVWGVIKFDGYGVGLLKMSELLIKHGVDRLAVVEPEDVLMLRQSGFDGDILFLRPAATGEELELLLKNRAILSVGSSAYAERCSAVAWDIGATARIHVAVDTGLGRYGFTTDRYDEIARLYRAKAPLSVEGIYTHFPGAFWNRRRTLRQFAAFKDLLKRLEGDGIDRGMAHVANSSALFEYDDIALDAVRIGSALLGRVAGTDCASTGLERVGMLEANISEVRELPSGSRTGYGNGKLILKNTVAAVAPIGHWDGLYDPETKIYIDTSEGETVMPRMIDDPASGHVMLDVTGKHVSVGDTVRADINPLRLNAAVTKVYI